MSLQKCHARVQTLSPLSVVGTYFCLAMVSNPFSRGHKGDVSDEEEKGEQELFADSLEEQGANVNVFDDDMSPHEKARQAAKMREEVKPRGKLAEEQRKKQEEADAQLYRAVPSDMNGTRTSANVNLKDVDQASRQRGQLGGDQLVPGALPCGSPSLDIPEWFKVGWIQNSRALLGLTPDQMDIDQARLRDTSLVTQFVSDAYYGYMWFDAGAIIVSVALTYIFTCMGGGISLAVIVAAIACTYYTTSTRRTRERARDDVARELARHRMLSENETAGWINNFLMRFWLIYEPVLSATIIQQVDAALKENCPPFLDSLRLTTFTLGTKPPVIDSVRTLADTDDDVIVMDWRFNFTPNDVRDMTVRRASNRINPKIVLTVRVGKGMVGAGLPILLENVSFGGLLRIRMKLIPNFPHIQVVDLSFMQAPTFDFELKPIGGSQFGLDVSALPGLSGFIHNQVHSALSPMMYSPNQFSLNLEEMMNGTPLDATCGVLQVTVWNARGLRRLQMEGGSPRPYISISLNGSQELARTRTVDPTSDPTFRETKYLLLKDLQGLLSLIPMDENDGMQPARLGESRFDLSTLNTNPSPGRLNKAIMFANQPVGSVNYTLEYYPIMKPEIGPDGQTKPLPETAAGVMHLTMHQARHLVKPESFGKLNAKARLSLNQKVIKETAVIKDTSDPVFEDVTEFVVIERFGSTVTVDILGETKSEEDQVIASMSVKVDDLINATKRKQDWFPFPGVDDSQMRMSAQFKPILMAGSINGSNSYRPAIGILKFWVKGARDVKNVEALSGGKSDPYVMLSANNIPLHGSSVIEDNLNPDWDQVLYAPVHALAETVRAEVFDYQNSSTDRSLGFCDVPVGTLAEEDVDNETYPYRGTGRVSREEKLKQPNGTTKGTLYFDVEFIPAMQVEGANFIEQNKQLEEEKRKDMPGSDDATGGSALDSPDARAAAGAATRAGDANLQGMSEDDEEEGVELSKDQLMSSPSGILVFNLISGTIGRSNARLEVIFDDSYWPAHTTEKSKDYEWDEVGEAVIRELDVSNVWFRLRTGKRDSDVFAEYTCTTKSLLDRALSGPTKLQLTPTGNAASGATDKVMNAPGAALEKGMQMPGAATKHLNPANLSKMPGKALDAGAHTASKGFEMAGNVASGNAFVAEGGEILMSCRYIPMNVHLEPIESVVNQGSLSIEVLHCENLASADRGGKSDPYVLFQDDGETLARTKTVKKTLNPQFNELLPEVLIKSRLTHQYCFNVRDWDQVGASDPLGKAYVNLAELEPFETHERTYPLTGEGAIEGSTITVRLTFHPRYLNNIVGKYGNAMGNMAHGVIGGIGHLGKGVASGGMSFGQQLMSKVGLKSKEDKEAQEDAAKQYAQHAPPSEKENMQQQAEQMEAEQGGGGGGDAGDVSTLGGHEGASMNEAASTDQSRKHRGLSNLFKKRK